MSIFLYKYILLCIIDNMKDKTNLFLFSAFFVIYFAMIINLYPVINIIMD